ncbi:MAG TPA: exodeoxyribonuclease VII large subunit, partial [Methylocystis sp.]|nr:exodeoxyribonuclease VII large subunit [Methylocystis sp.]
ALERGFALVRDAAGAIVRSADAVRAGQRLELEFSDGKVWTQAEGSSEHKPRRARKATDESQGSLF